MAAEEERRARAILAEMQMRISQGPYAALSVSDVSTAEDVRAAFLQLTKQFHPARFGRMSGEIHKIANEVFLGIKSAHDQLTKQLGSSGRPMSRAQSPAIGAQGTDLNRAQTGPGTVRGTGLVPRTATQSGVTFARGTDRNPQRPSTPQITPPAGSTRPITAGLGARTSQQITTANPRLATPPHGVQARSSSPSGDNPTQRITPPSGIPAQPRSPSSPLSTQRPGTPPLRPGTPPSRPSTPNPDAINPPTIRYSGVQPTQALPKSSFDEHAELAAAMDLLSSKDYSGARQAFHALAAKLPQTRRYRALLCFARGRETQAMGRTDDAVMEFQRALQLDPDLEIAKQAIRELGRKSRL